MAGAAQLVEHLLAVVALVLAARRRAGGKVSDFRDLRDTLVDAGQGVGFVVDDDEQLQLVERQDAPRRTSLCHAASFRSGLPSDGYSIAVGGWRVCELCRCDQSCAATYSLGGTPSAFLNMVVKAAGLS